MGSVHRRLKSVSSLTILLISIWIFQSNLFAQLLSEKQPASFSAHNKDRFSFTFDSLSPLKQVGYWGWGPCYDVAVSGNRAFIGNGDLLQVLDVSNADYPIPVGELSTGSLVLRVALAGNFAFTIPPFQIIDVSDPANPSIVSTLQLPGGLPPTAIAIHGGYAYVGDFYGNVYVIDVSHPSNPQIIGRMLTSGENVQSIILEGTTLFVSTADGLAIDIFDISDAASPTHIGQISSGSPAGPMAIQGHYLLFGTSQILQVYDVGIRTNPLYVNKVNLGSYIYSVTVIDTTAFVTLANTGFETLDVADVKNIREGVELSNPYGFPNSQDIGFAPKGEYVVPPYAYLATGTGMWTVHIGEQHTSNSVSFFPTGWYVNGIATDSSNHAFIAELYGGLKILDFASPNSPILVGEYSTNEEVRDVIVSGNFAYLLCDSDLQVVDITALSKPVMVTKLPFGDTLNDNNGYSAYGCMELIGNTLFVGRNSDKISCIDVTDPSAPTIDCSKDTRRVPIAISHYQQYVYVAEADTGVEIFDSSTRSTLSVSGFLHINPLRGLSIAGTELFVTDVATISSFNILDPLNPVFKYSLKLSGGYQTAVIKVSGSSAYVANAGNLIVLDISNPDSGRIVYSADAKALGADFFSALGLSNGIVLTGYFGLWFFKSDLTTPVEDHNTNLGNVDLLCNYPNPFNPCTLIKYRLSKPSNVLLRVYDVLGREVALLVSGDQQAGNHVVLFDGSKYSSGIYFYRLEALDDSGERFVCTKKMELLK